MRPAGQGGAREFTDSGSGAEPAWIIPRRATAVNFAEKARQLRAAGYAPVPIVPGTKRPLLDGWPSLADAPPPDEEFRRWLDWYGADHGWGVVCGRVIGIDLDDDDPIRATILMSHAIDALGVTTLVRIGRPNRRMLIYRADGEIRSAKRHDLSVEVLSSGCQFVAYAIHPDTGAPYTWPLSDLAATPYEQLPSITQAQVDDFLARVERSLPPRAVTGSSGGAFVATEWTRNDAGLVTDGREDFLRHCTFRAFWSCQEAGDATVATVAAVAWSMFAAEADLDIPKSKKGGGHWSERDALAKAKGIVRKFEAGRLIAAKRRRLVEGVNAEDTPCEPLPLAEAETRLDTVIRSFFARAMQSLDNGGPPPQVLIRAVPGLGKTRAALDAVREVARDVPDRIAPPTIWFAVPTVRLAEEAAQRYGRGAVVVRGRTRDHDEALQMCRRAEVIAEAQAKGITNIARAFCFGKDEDGNEQVCPHRTGCPYWAQFDEAQAADVIFLAHEYLFLEMDRTTLPKADIVVIDESILSAAVALPHRMPPADLIAQAADEDRTVIRDVLGELATGIDIRQRLRQTFGEEAAGELRKIAERAEGSRPKLHPGLADNIIRERLRTVKRPLLAPLLRHLADELSLSRPGARSVYVDANATIQNAAGEVGAAPMVYAQWRNRPRLPAQSSILLLDGTGEPDLLRALFPMLEVETIDAARNAYVVQAYGFTGAKSKMTGTEAVRVGAEVAGVCARLPGPGLLVTHLDATDRIALPDGWAVEHFGALRGIDEHKAMETVVVVGRALMKAADAERIARALFYDSETPLSLGREYEKRASGLRVRDGRRLGVETWRHPDPIVDLVRATAAEREIEQAVDRLRLVRRDQPAVVLLLNETPTRIVVDGVAPWAVLARSRPLMVMQRLNGVLPLVPGWLAERFPDLWPTAQAAKRDLQAGVMGPNSYIDLYGNGPITRLYGNGPITAPTRYRFRRAGQRGPEPSAAWSGLSSEATREALEGWFGPLVLFEAE